MQDDACYGHLLSGDTPHLQVVENEGVAMAKAMGRPALYDAILLFPDAGPGRTNGSSGSSEVSRQLLRYTLRMNHTGVRVLFGEGGRACACTRACCVCVFFVW